MKVLDCYGGLGVVWGAVEKATGKKVDRTAIDIRHDLRTFHLHGDNTKVMSGLNLQGYDVIDLDAYGIPYDQMREVFEQGYRGVVFVTAIQTVTGNIPKGLLVDIGFPPEITSKAVSIPARHGWSLVKEWLALKGVKKIVHRSKNRKHYFCFNTVD